MRKFNIQIILMIISYSYCFSQTVADDPVYTSVLTDDFTSTTVSSTDWIPRYGWGTFTNTNTNSGLNFCGGANWDLPCLQMNFTANHNIIANGSTCELIGLKENVTGEVWTWPCGPPYNCFTPVNLPFKYSNGMLSSVKKFLYGYFEIKFRVNGLSATNAYNTCTPTFWLYNNNSTIPWSEIDIFEIDGINKNFTNNIHTVAVSGNPPTGDYYETGNNTINLSQWHTAAIEWTPDYIDFYLDNTFLRRSTSADNQNLIEMPLIIENSFPMLNFCHPIDATNTPFPITYELDYVKVLQPKQECGTDKTYCNVTESTFDSKLYKSLSIGGSGCSAIFNNGTVHAAGADFVLLDVGFEVGNNMNMLIDTPPCYISTTQQRTASELLTPIPANFQQIYNSSRSAQH